MDGAPWLKVKMGEGNMFFQGTFTEVKAGSGADLAAYSDRALLLCWPYNAIEAEMNGLGDWDAACLDRWQGKPTPWGGRGGGVSSLAYMCSGL